MVSEDDHIYCGYLTNRMWNMKCVLLLTDTVHSNSTWIN